MRYFGFPYRLRTLKEEAVSPIDLRYQNPLEGVAAKNFLHSSLPRAVLSDLPKRGLMYAWGDRFDTVGWVLQLLEAACCFRCTDLARGFFCRTHPVVEHIGYTSSVTNLFPGCPVQQRQNRQFLQRALLFQV